MTYMTLIFWMILLPRNVSNFCLFFSNCYCLGSWLIQLASPCLEDVQVEKDAREVYSSPFPLIAYKGLSLSLSLSLPWPRYSAKIIWRSHTTTYKHGVEHTHRRRARAHGDSLLVHLIWLNKHEQIHTHPPPYSTHNVDY